MRRITIYGGLLFLLAGTVACDGYLDKEPLSSPTTGSFLNNEAEMEGALTGVYRSVNWETGLTPYQQSFDLWSDIGVERSPGVAEGTFDTYNGALESIWSYAYTTIQRANTLLSGMEAGKDRTDAAAYNRIQAEARILRAWAYFYLINLYGDVPLVTTPLVPEEYNQTRTPKEEIIDFLLAEMDAVSEVLPWRPSTPGRVAKGVALGMKARIALYAERYREAADAAQAVIESGEFGLNPRFQDLFTRPGQAANANNEIMFQFLYASSVNITTYVPLGQASRNLSGQSGKFPTQRLVDMFEAIDGKRIDESSVYDPAQPSRNRDPRLRWTVTMHGDTISGVYSGGAPTKRLIYNIYDDNTLFYNFASDTWTAGANLDKSNPFGPVNSGVGYLWAKYTNNPEDLFQAKVGWIYMRYAEILLTYAEAKIELGEIDQSVVNAINEVRTRGDGTSALPPVDPLIASDPQKMQQLIRRERTVELALEGFRWFDIRRWKIAELVMPGRVYGASRSAGSPAATPNFKVSAVTDLNNIPDYSASDGQRFARDMRHFEEKHYLMPIPQRERDINPNLSQNADW